MRKLGKLRVEKVWAHLTNPSKQLSHQIGFPCPCRPPVRPSQCYLDAWWGLRDAVRIEIGLTYGLTGVGARDSCASKIMKTFKTKGSLQICGNTFKWLASVGYRWFLLWKPLTNVFSVRFNFGLSVWSGRIIHWKFQRLLACIEFYISLCVFFSFCEDDEGLWLV